jgi:hypothetical protein
VSEEEEAEEGGRGGGAIERPEAFACAAMELSGGASEPICKMGARGARLIAVRGRVEEEEEEEEREGERAAATLRTATFSSACDQGREFPLGSQGPLLHWGMMGLAEERDGVAEDGERRQNDGSSRGRSAPNEPMVTTAAEGKGERGSASREGSKRADRTTVREKATKEVDGRGGIENRREETGKWFF